MLVCMLAMAWQSHLHAQALPPAEAGTGRISGLVSDMETKLPLPGATVRLKSNPMVGTTTDENGNFIIQASDQQTIVFSYIGFQNQEIVYKGQKNLSVALLASSTQLNEIVTVGYQTQRKVDLTGAVSIVSVDNLKNAPTANPIKSLQGQVPGLFITTSGDPSGAATVRIRGVNTLNNNHDFLPGSVCPRLSLSDLFFQHSFQMSRC